MAIERGCFEWDIQEIAKALKISEKDVKEYFRDGRRISFLLERRIAYEVLDGSLADSEGAGYDVLDSEGKKWEVRSVSSGGVYFCPSYMVGSGRKFEKSGFLEKLEEIAGYIVSDIQKFPTVPCWIIPVETVRKWWEEGKLGTTTKITRDKALKLIRRM